MSKFNTKKPSTRVSNLAGGVAFKMEAKTELTHAVLSTFLEDKYYESQDARLDRIRELTTKVPDTFIAQLAFVAREEFNLRSVSHALIGELAKKHSGDDLVKRTIVKCALRPDDLLEIASYVGTPLPKQVKRGIRNALLKFDRYQLAKYKGEGKDLSMVDLFNLVHPKAQHANPEQVKAWADLMSGNLKETDTWESEISANASKETWEKLLAENKIGYMALLRNLNNLVKYDVSEEAQEKAISILTDLDKVRRSRQLPFRFYTAYKNVRGNRRFLDAVSLAMDHAVGNTPEFAGKTLIAIDTSGSMTQGADAAITKAAIFGATLLKANVNADVILYDTQIKQFMGSSRVPVVDIAEKIINDANGGGTDTSLVFRYAIYTGKKYDRVIILSDNESWSGYNTQYLYNKYKSLMGADPFVYAIDIQGYGTSDVSGSKVRHLVGWSERLLDFVGQAEKGESLVKYIESMEL